QGAGRRRGGADPADDLGGAPLEDGAGGSGGGERRLVDRRRRGADERGDALAPRPGDDRLRSGRERADRRPLLPRHQHARLRGRARGRGEHGVATTRPGAPQARRADVGDHRTALMRPTIGRGRGPAGAAALAAGLASILALARDRPLPKAPPPAEARSDKEALFGDPMLVPSRAGERAREELALAGEIERLIAAD